MMKKINEPFLEFIRGRFENESTENQGWNDPGELVFHQAISVIEDSKEKTKGSLFIPIAILVGILFISYTAWTLVGNNDTSTTVGSASFVEENQTESLGQELNSTAVIAKPNKTEQKGLNEVAIENTSAQDRLPIAQKSTEEVVTQNTTTEEVVSQNIVKEEVVLQDVVNINDVTNNIVKVKSGLPQDNVPSQNLGLHNVSKKSESAIVNLSKEIVKYKELASIDQLGLIQMQAALEVSQRALPILQSEVDLGQTKTSISNPNRASITASVRNSLTNMKVENHVHTGTVGGQDKFKSGLGFNIEFRKPISKKLSVLASASYDRMQHQNYSTNEMDYDKSNESRVNTNGEVTYTDEVVIHSLVGSFTENMEFNIDPLLTDENSTLTQSVEFKHSATVINLGTGLSYNILDGNAFTWDASISGGVSLLTGLSAQMTSTYSVDNLALEGKGWSDGDVSDNNSFFATASLGTSFGYKISENLSLQAGGSFQVGISDINRNLETNVTSRTRVWTTQIGLRSYF